ncbi:MAG: acyltransferase [Microthrixaceae bacterium]
MNEEAAGLSNQPPQNEPGLQGSDQATGPRFISNANKLGYFPPLDGLRGIGIMLVILTHAAFKPFASFASSVDMFFVVSGFLITTLLLEEGRKSGRVNTRQFYYRRALRLLPLLYLVLLLTFLAVLIIHVIFDERELLNRTISDVLAGGTYTYHVIHPVHAELVGGGDAPIRPLIQLWSLSVEEHFYLFGVIFILVIIRFKKTKALIAGFIAAWLLIGIARLTGHVGPNFAWYQRPDALLIGVAIAFLNAHMPSSWSPRVSRIMSHVTTAAVVIMALVVLSGTYLAKLVGLYIPFLVPKGGSLHDGLYWGEFGFTVVSGCVAILVLTLVRCRDHWLVPILSFKPFTEVGIRSYGLYLIHVPLGVLLIETVGRKSQGLALLLYLPLLALTTEVAHRWVEKPAMKLKNRMSTPSVSSSAERDSTPQTD